MVRQRLLHKTLGMFPKHWSWDPRKRCREVVLHALFRINFRRSHLTNISTSGPEVRRYCFVHKNLIRSTTMFLDRSMERFNITPQPIDDLCFSIPLRRPSTYQLGPQNEANAKRKPTQACQRSPDTLRPKQIRTVLIQNADPYYVAPILLLLRRNRGSNSTIRHMAASLDVVEPRNSKTAKAQVTVNWNVYLIGPTLQTAGGSELEHYRRRLSFALRI